MKTPVDASGSPGGVVALLNSGDNFVFCDLWTITLNGGGQVLWSGAQVPVTFNGQTWPLGPAIDRGKITARRGVEVSTVEMQVSAGPEDLINGVPLLAFLQARGFDGARVRLDRAYMAAWGAAVTGTINKFQGRVTSIKSISRTEANVTVSSDLVLLNISASPDFYQAPCLNTLYDSACTVSQAANTDHGQVTGSPTVSGFSTSLTAADGIYAQGLIAFSSGANQGVSRSVKSYAGGVVQVAPPLPAAPAVGDQFSITKGCDLTMATCQSRFDNLRYFRGQPFTPPPETIYG